MVDLPRLITTTPLFDMAFKTHAKAAHTRDGCRSLSDLLPSASSSNLKHHLLDRKRLLSAKYAATFRDESGDKWDGGRHDDGNAAHRHAETDRALFELTPDECGDGRHPDRRDDD